MQLVDLFSAFKHKLDIGTGGEKTKGRTSGYIGESLISEHQGGVIWL